MLVRVHARILALALVACAPATPAVTDTPATPAAPITPAVNDAPLAPATTPATDALPPCTAPTTPRLDYRDLEIGGTYHVDVIPRDADWIPADHVPMPMHHATRLEWQNPDIIPALAPAATGRLRFTFTVDARDIRQVPDRREWRVTVRATITAICAPQ